MYYIAEYVNVLTVSAIAATLFFGGWTGPFNFLPGPWWLLIKMVVFAFVFVWLRATLPRLRYDQLMRLSWGVLLPLGLLNVHRDRACWWSRCPEPADAGRRARSWSGASGRRCGTPAQPPLTVSYPEVKRDLPADVPRSPPAVHARRRPGALHRLRAVRGGLSVAGASTSRPPTTTRPARSRRASASRPIYEINMIRCIFCGYCEEACPVDAIKLGPEYELADFARPDFVYTKEMLLDPEALRAAAPVPPRRRPATTTSSPTRPPGPAAQSHPSPTRRTWARCTARHRALPALRLREPGRRCASCDSDRPASADSTPRAPTVPRAPTR